MNLRMFERLMACLGCGFIIGSGINLLTKGNDIGCALIGAGLWAFYVARNVMERRAHGGSGEL